MNQTWSSMTLRGTVSELCAAWGELPWGTDLAVRVTLVLAGAWLAQGCLRRGHARWRVVLWRGTALSLTVLPLAGLWGSRMEIPVGSATLESGGSSMPRAESAFANEEEDGGGGFLREFANEESGIPGATGEAYSIARITAAGSGEGNPFAFFESAGRRSDLLRESVTGGVLTVIWIAGVLVLMGRWVAGQWSVRRLVRGCSPAPSNCVRVLGEVRRQLGWGGEVELRVSEKQEVPFAAGISRGVIVVPRRLCAGDEEMELRGVLAHELAHHQSRDLAWMGVWQWLGIALWFHPLAWRVPRVHGMACEEGADAIAARVTGSAAEYAGILARTALRCRRVLPAGLVIPMAASPEIMTRLERLDRGYATTPPARRRIAAAIALWMWVTAGIAGIEFVRGAGESGVGAARVLKFPEERVIGTISISTGVKETWAERQTQATCMPYLEWQEGGTARGEVAIPEGALVKLTLSATGANDPSWVTLLNADDIYELQIEGYGEGFRCGDDQMEQLCDLSGLQVLRVRQIDLTDRGAKSLERLQNLRILETNRSYLTNAGLKSLGKLTRLESLTFSAEPNPKLDDSGLAALASLTSLKEFHLHSRGLTGAGMKHLIKLPELIWFRPGGSPTPDLYLSSFRGAKAVKVIDLSHLEVTDEGLKHLASFPQLEEINLYKCPKLSDAGMTHLKALKTLRRIDVGVELGPRSATAITKRGVGELAELPHLTKLFLNNVDADDECCRRLSQHKEMTHLWIGGKGLTDAGIADLAKLTKLERLTLSNSQITDRGMESLSALTNVKDLTIGNAKQLTDAGMESLSKMRSLEALELGYGPQMTMRGMNKLNALSELRVLAAGLNENSVPGTPPLNLSGLKELRQFYFGPIRDDDLASLSGLQKLEWLLVGGETLSDKGLTYAGNMKSLTRLQYNTSRLPTDAGTEHLKNLDRLFELGITGTFSDTGLARMGELKSLQVLKVNSFGGEISQKAREEMFVRLPNLKWATFDGNRVVPEATGNDERLNQPAPDFSVVSLNGNPLGLADFKGKVLLLYFWSTDCRPCVAATPEIKKSYETVQREFRDFRMLSLSTEISDERVRAHVEKYDLSWPQARIGRDSKVAASYGVDGNPHYVVIDRKGIVRHSGPSGTKLDERLRGALEGK